MRLYGRYGPKGLQSAIKTRSMVNNALNPSKRSNVEPPVSGYFAWYQALTDEDITQSGGAVTTWRGRGPGGALLTTVGGPVFLKPGITFPADNSAAIGGFLGQPRTVFAVFGATSLPQFAGILTDAQSEFILVNTAGVTRNWRLCPPSPQTCGSTGSILHCTKEMAV